MARAQRLVAARRRTTLTAHEYWARNRQHDRPRQLQAAARPPTSDRTDRETGRSSSTIHHRSPQCVPDRVFARGERIRVASAGFPCLVELRLRRVSFSPTADLFHGQCDEDEKGVEDPNT